MPNPTGRRIPASPWTAAEASPVEGLLFFGLEREDDDADVVDEVVHPLTLLTARYSSGNVTEGVDEMVEAWPPRLLQKVGKKTLSFSWDSPICSGSD